MSQQVTESSPTTSRLLVLPRPRLALAGRAAPARAPRPAPRAEGRLDGAERLDRREALLHRLELDRQRRRYRSA
jgi:hypothetical protein